MSCYVATLLKSASDIGSAA